MSQTPIEYLLAVLDEPNPSYNPKHEAAQVAAAEAILTSLAGVVFAAPDLPRIQAAEKVAEDALARLMSSKSTPITERVRAAAVLAKRGHLVGVLSAKVSP